MVKAFRHPYQPKLTRLERWYGQQLRKIARHVGDIIGAFPVGDPASAPVISRAMDDYAALLDGWAQRTAMKMLEGAVRDDDALWRLRSNEMSKAVHEEIMRAPTGEILRRLMNEQVTLIKSIPLDAAQRVHEWTLTGIEDATRAGEVAKAIQASGDVAASRAMLIARTEVSRASSNLTQARAQFVGSTSYIWRTVGDFDVRKSHREMDGKVCQWDSPPTLSDGTTTTPGCIWNCRCFAEPILS